MYIPRLDSVSATPLLEDQNIVAAAFDNKEKYLAKSKKWLELSFTYLQQSNSPDDQVSIQPSKLRGKITRFLEKAKAVQPETEELQTNIQKLTEVLDHLKVQIVKIDCGKAGELEFDKEHLVKIPFFKTILEQFGEFDNADRVLPLPNNLTPNQLLSTYAYAEKGEIAETTIDLLMEQYLVASFLEYEEYEKVLHAKITDLSPMSLVTLDAMDFGLFERSINETFSEKVGQIVGRHYLKDLMKKIEGEKDAEVKATLLKRFIIFNNCFKAIKFDNKKQLAAFLGDLGDDAKRLIRFVDVSFRPNIQEFDEIIELLTMTTNIEEVKFLEDFLADEHLAKLKNIKSLTRIELSNCRKVTVRGIECLSTMPHLTHLSLKDMSHLTDKDLKPLINLELQLQWLDLSNCQSFTDICIKETISHLHMLTYLGLRNTNISRGLVYLQKTMNLTRLDLSYMGHLKDRNLSDIASMTQLTHLNLEASGRITNDGLSHIAGLVNLAYLNLSFLPRISGDCFRLLAGFANLTHLNLSCLHYEVSNDDLRHFSSLTKLVYFDISGSGITDQWLSHIAGLTQLIYLKVMNANKITNKGMEHLSGLTHLIWLDLDSSGLVGNKGLTYLSKLTGLVYLNLNGVPDVTDRGMTNFSRMTRLNWLYLDPENRISQNAIDNFRKVNPHCKIRTEPSNESFDWYNDFRESLTRGCPILLV